jgi:hypothetical protein
LVSFFLFNVARTTINFYSALLTSGGKTSTFFIGSQAEISNAFVRTDTLYQHLVQSRVENVYAEFFIILPLQFYDLDHHRFRRLDRLDAESRLPDNAERSSSFIVSYLGVANRIRPQDFGACELWTFEHFAISGFTPGQSGTSPSWGR